ncbi:hypothetical protein [Massilia sp. CF038]|uniref:hypothetical protein n=1 Tax=Massilia sp. CF038 TaxID=1881045 RepID=UPI00091D60E5|nr:hypothetical protein [Massilia sp. CF038]SHH02335.1 hypothetical protein SAMN05428948_2376 [Massilia sp. CF038]
MEAIFGGILSLALAQALQPFTALPPAQDGQHIPSLDIDNKNVTFEAQRGGHVSGAAGRIQYVQVAQGALAIYDKRSGALLRPPLALSTLFYAAAPSRALQTCAHLHQGPVSMLYDHLAERWMFAYHASQAPYLCLLVSAGANAAGRYHAHAIALHGADGDPALAMWRDAILLTFSIRTGGTRICSMNASAMAGAQPKLRCSELAASGVTAAAMAPNAAIKTGTPALLLALDFAAAGRGSALSLWRYDHANNRIAGLVKIPVAPFIAACTDIDAGICMPQPHAGALLPAHANRLAPRIIYDGRSLLLNHSVLLAHGQIGLRWYEIRDALGAPQVYQQGTQGTDGDNRWMGSIGIDKMGNIALGYAVASAATAATIRYTGRLHSDPPGRMQGEQTVVNGSGVQSTRVGLSQPAGMLALDPTDGCTFWYTQQYIQSSSASAWQSRVVSFKFRQCE